MARRHNNILKKLAATYCRLRTSDIAGIGIFAIRDIPKNTNPFPGVRNQRWYKFRPAELKSLDHEVLKMINDFYVTEPDGTISIPSGALNGMDISFFLNTSSAPNVKIVDGGINFSATRKIKKGEELTVAYHTYDCKYKKPLN